MKNLQSCPGENKGAHNNELISNHVSLFLFSLFYYNLLIFKVLFYLHVPHDFWSGVHMAASALPMEWNTHSFFI